MESYLNAASNQVALGARLEELQQMGNEKPSGACTSHTQSAAQRCSCAVGQKRHVKPNMEQSDVRAADARKLVYLRAWSQTCMMPRFSFGLFGIVRYVDATVTCSHCRTT